MKKKSILLSCFTVALILMGCSKNNVATQWPWQDPEKPETPVEPDKPVDPNDTEKPTEPEEPSVPDLTVDWTDVSSEYGDLPSYIKVKKSPSKLVEKNAIAYIAIADMSKAKFELWSIDDPENKGTKTPLATPSDIYSSKKSKIIINAGYFYSSGGKNYSSSLAISESKVYAWNINYACDDWEKGIMYYPTRAAFVEDGQGGYQACWTYYNGNVKKNYIYQSPADNSWKKQPLQIPDASFPEKASDRVPKFAIGGGPLLVKEGKVINSKTQELWDGKSGIMPNENHPRTAVGYTKDNKIIFFVCEGRRMTPNVSGLTTGDVAQVMKSIGCVEAINLDGGGSSCMLVNGKETIKPSDKHQRKVGSILMLN